MKKPSIAAIKEQLVHCRELDATQRQQLEADDRVGVRRLLEIWKRKRANEQTLIEKFHEMNVFEDKLHADGFQAIAGIDEAGRGPLAGPVVAACVILQPGTVILGLNDSKKLSASKRDALFDQIQTNALSYGIGTASAKEIDTINIYQAAKQAMLRALADMTLEPDYLLVDAMTLPVLTAQESLIKGDARSNSVAAASILAKVTRDRQMKELDQCYPGYGFAEHKGYGTALHLQAIEKLGPCPEHRMTFAPLHS